MVADSPALSQAVGFCLLKSKYAEVFFLNIVVLCATIIYRLVG